jgi:aspartate/methionine/tyrosine aminotransferase
VLDREELQGVAELCVEHDLLALTDEIYEHIRYAGEHVPLATCRGWRERTVTIVERLSKTFSVTGWRLGYDRSRRRTSPTRSARCTTSSPSARRRRSRRRARSAWRFDADYARV